MNTNNFDLNISTLGSAALNSIYPSDRMVRLVAESGAGDYTVRLYACSKGTFFATTNGDPFTEQEFADAGYPTIEGAAEWVKAGMPMVA